MVEIIVIAIIVFLFIIWLLFMSQFSITKRQIKKREEKTRQRQANVEFIIGKIESTYGERSIRIMFQELDVPQLSELLVIFEESEIVIILGEPYSFSEILNVKAEGCDYIHFRRSIRSTITNELLEMIVTGKYASLNIKEALSELENSPILLAKKNALQKVEFKIITSRRSNPEIIIQVSLHSVDETLLALTKIIDKGGFRTDPGYRLRVE